MSGGQDDAQQWIESGWPDGMLYLACPYSHPEGYVQQARFTAVNKMVKKLKDEGAMVHSPIIHGHPITVCGASGDWETWEREDRWHIERCAAVLVLKLDGWEDSRDVAAEVAYAEELGKPVHYLEPVDEVREAIMSGRIAEARDALDLAENQ